MMGSIPWRVRRWAMPALLVCASVRADIITVPRDYATIQAGINASQDGDEVVVSPGIYFENINFIGRDITVRSIDPLDPTVVDCTIIDGQSLSSVVVMDRGSLSGFTIRNGNAWPAGGDGGGVRLWYAVRDAEISHNVITDCIAQYGGGIRASGTLSVFRVVRHNIITNNEAWAGGGIAAGSVLVENNLISFNETCCYGTGPHGGGISAGASAVIRDNLIVGNTSQETGGGVAASTNALVEDNMIVDNFCGNGGGGVAAGGAGVVVRNNTILGNSVLLGGGGGGVSFGRGTLVGNTIVGNRAGGGGDGGGALGVLALGGELTIAGNLIAGNAAGELGGHGGGMYFVAYSGTASAWGNTIVGNAAAESGGLGSGAYVWAETDDTWFVGNVIAFSTVAEGLFIAPTNEAVVDYNCVFGHAGGDYGGAAQPGAHDVNADPLFVQNPDPGPDGQWGTEDDAYGDLRLQPGSPCIDAADNSAVPADATDLNDDGDTDEPIPLDLDSNARFVDDSETADVGSGECPVVDIGAYEFQDGTTICCPADLDGDGAVGASDLAELLGSWGPYEPCPPFDAADFNEDCGVNAADLAQLLGSWGPCQ